MFVLKVRFLTIVCYIGYLTESHEAAQEPISSIPSVQVSKFVSQSVFQVTIYKPPLSYAWLEKRYVHYEKFRNQHCNHDSRTWTIPSDRGHPLERRRPPPTGINRQSKRRDAGPVQRKIPIERG